MRPLILLCILALAGCKPAERYGAVKPTKKEPLGTAEKKVKPDDTPKKPPSDIAWVPPDLDRMPADIPIQFVAASSPEEWKKLEKFWTPSTPLPPAFVGFDPFGTGALAKMAQNRVVKIKVPAGLWDPNKYDYLPPTNPPTVGKWQLGKQLFFDDTWLLPADVQKHSCATCHNPAKGFSTGRHVALGLNPPSLINVAYNRWQFHDGRARALEEVVQQTPSDEVAGTDAMRRHVWPGVVERLRTHPQYPDRFRAVFGTTVTQDAIGKALATYMRTILSGNSIYDRALAAAGGSYGNPKELTADHFETALKTDGKNGKDTITALNALLKNADMSEYKTDNPNQLARALLDGYKLFKDKGRCARCHSDPRDFTDYGFHNLNVGQSSRPGEELFGRIRSIPVGLKDRSLIGAVKTPTLRNLSQTAPYWHDGSGVHPESLSKLGLFNVVVWHTRGGQSTPHKKGDTINPFLDKELRNDKGEPLDLNLKEQEVRDLVLFLLALDGDPIDAIVTEKNTWPPGMTPPKQ
jgi:cytochrome c peroxidase